MKFRIKNNSNRYVTNYKIEKYGVILFSYFPIYLNINNALILPLSVARYLIKQNKIYQNNRTPQDIYWKYSIEIYEK